MPVKRFSHIILFSMLMLSSFARQNGAIDTIMRQTMKVAEVYGNAVNSYDANVYMRTTIQTDKKNFLYKFTHFIPQFIIHDVKNDKAIIESFSRLKYEAPNNFTQDVTNVNGSLSGKKEIGMLPFWILRINLYKSSKFNDLIIMPFSDNSAGYYDYKLLSDSADTYKIQYSSRYKHSKLMNGDFTLEKNTWRLKEFNGEFHDIFISYFFNIKMGEDESTLFLPVRYDITQTASYLGNKVSNRFQTTLEYQKVNYKESGVKKNNYNLGTKFRFRLDSVPLNTDSTFWNKRRTIPLSPKEKKILSEYNVRKKSEVEIKKAQDSVPKNNGIEALKFIVANTNYRFKSTNINYSGFLNPTLLGYTTQDGFLYLQKATMSNYLKRHQSINSKAFFGYIFGRKELSYGISSVWNYEPAKMGYLSLSVGRGNNNYSMPFLQMVKDSLNNQSLNFGAMGLSMYKNYYLKLFNSIELANGLQFGAGLDYYIRQANIKQDAAYPQGIKELFHTRNLFVPMLSLSWTPGQYYIIDGALQKVYVHSKYPTFKVLYAHGVSDFFYSVGNYSRTEFDISQSIQIDLMRSLQYRLGYGFFSNVKDVDFYDFKYFERSSFPERWEDGVGGMFNVMPYSYFTASERYAQAHFMFETPRLALTRIPQLSGGVVKERLYLSQLHSPYLPSYTEVGYGIGNRFFNAAVFFAFKKQAYYNLAAKIVFLM